MDPILSIDSHGEYLYLTWHNHRHFDLGYATLLMLRDRDFETWSLVGIQWMDDVVVLKFHIKGWHVMGIKPNAYKYVDEIMESIDLTWENYDQSVYYKH